jgi:hypothetical protein
MPILAPKIFANDPLPLQQSVLNLLTPAMGLEVALYGYHPFPLDVSERIRALPSSVKMLHLWQQRVSLSGLLQRDAVAMDGLDFELTQARHLGISNAVIHHGYSHHALEDTYLQHPKPYAEAVSSLLRETHLKGLRLHFENTFEGVQFHRRFFERLIALGFAADMGFCLDLGHTRVFSGDTLDDWLALVCDLRDAGVSIHYHVHVNRGRMDDHLTLCDGHFEALLDANPPWVTTDFLSWLQKAIDATPDAIFCQEHPAEKASEALWFFRELMADERIRFHPQP